MTCIWKYGQCKLNCDNLSRHLPRSVPHMCLRPIIARVDGIPILGRSECLYALSEMSYFYDWGKLRIFGILNWNCGTTIKPWIPVHNIKTQRTVLFMFFVLFTQCEIWQHDWGGLLNLPQGSTSKVLSLVRYGFRSWFAVKVFDDHYKYYFSPFHQTLKNSSFKQNEYRKIVPVIVHDIYLEHF